MPTTRTALALLCLLWTGAVSGQTRPATLTPAATYSSSADKPGLSPAADLVEAPPPAVTPVIASTNISTQCRSGQLDAKRCKFRWRNALLETFEFLAVQHTMNISMDSTLIPTSFSGSWWDNYMRALHEPRFGHWNDGDEFIVNYVSHPMMGAVAGFIEVQNEPKSMGLEISKSGAYWKSRGRGVLWAAVYAAQWEVGPLSEASIGGEGICCYISHANHGLTNGAGLVDFVMTPAGGGVWMVGEDALDKILIKRLERVSRNPAWLLAISILNPNRSAANLLRFKTPWHRDSRIVRPPLQ